jgi:hypothetical protein
MWDEKKHSWKYSKQKVCAAGERERETRKIEKAVRYRVKKVIEKGCRLRNENKEERRRTKENVEISKNCKEYEETRAGGKSKKNDKCVLNAQALRLLNLPV